MAKKKQNTPAAAPSFEEAIAKLEEIVQHLEEGNVGLAESLKLYEEGASLLKAGHQLLAEAEQRIERVSGNDADGNPVIEPLDGTDHAEKPAGSRKKAKKSVKQSDKKTAGDEGSVGKNELF